MSLPRRARAPRGVRAWSVLAAAAVAAALLAGCTGRPPQACADIPLTEAAAAQLAAAAGEVAFVPRVPCGYNGAFVVRSVFTDVVPGDPPQPRVTFEVARKGERAFLLSETRARMGFWAIPQGSHPLLIAGGDRVSAGGFAGPAGNGDDIAYVRWRDDDVTYELAATLRAWLTERDVQALAAGMIASGG